MLCPQDRDIPILGRQKPFHPEIRILGYYAAHCVVLRSSFSGHQILIERDADDFVRRKDWQSRKVTIYQFANQAHGMLF
jgi:hypothetical protein